MFKPSTAPRWKIAIRSLRRDPTAAAARPRNDGAKPSDSMAIAPDFRNTLRFIWASKSETLKFRRSKPQREIVWRRIGRQRDSRHVSRRDARREVHAADEAAGRDPRVGRVVVAGWWLAHVQRLAHLLQRLHQRPCIADRRSSSAHG